jgi:hypothetical protein
LLADDPGAQVGTKKRALRSNQETDERKLRRLGELIDYENPFGQKIGPVDEPVGRSASASLPGA